MSRSGIATMHRETRFRSRLEARWAYLFDCIGWRWEYEPFDLAGYIPDFLVLGERSLLVEIKPYSTRDECLREQLRLPACLPHGQLVVGTTPLLYDWSPVRTIGDLPIWIAGNLWYAEHDERDGHWYGHAPWVRCCTCNRVAVESFLRGPCFPCGHDCKRSLIGPNVYVQIERAWAQARNATQWKGA